MSNVKTAPQMVRAVPTAKPENTTTNTVGRTYGERAKLNPTPASSSSQNAQKSRFTSDEAKKKAVEEFAANDRFQKGFKVGGPGATPYKSARVEMLEKGMNQPLAAKNASPDDMACLQFLEDVIGTPALHTQRSLRQHLLTRTAPKKVVS